MRVSSTGRSGLVYRRPTWRDFIRLKRWRPDVGWLEHFRWFRRCIDQPYFWIIMAYDFVAAEMRPAGYLRFDLRRSTYWLSYLVDPAWRKMGLGRRIVHNAPTRFGGPRLYAYVEAGNNPSIRCFASSKRWDCVACVPDRGLVYRAKPVWRGTIGTCPSSHLQPAGAPRPRPLPR